MEHIILWHVDGCLWTKFPGEKWRQNTVLAVNHLTSRRHQGISIVGFNSENDC